MTDNNKIYRSSSSSGGEGKRIVLSALMLLLASPFCYAHGYTLADANHIIVALMP